MVQTRYSVIWYNKHIVQKYIWESGKVFGTVNDNKVREMLTPDTQQNDNKAGKFQRCFAETIEEVIGLQYFLSVVIYSISKNKEGV